MPLYDFLNEQTGEIEEHMVRLADRDQFVKDNPHLKQCLSTPGFVDSVRLGRTRHDNGFNEVLQKVKQHHPLGELNPR